MEIPYQLQKLQSKRISTRRRILNTKSLANLAREVVKHHRDNNYGRKGCITSHSLSLSLTFDAVSKHSPVFFNASPTPKLLHVTSLVNDQSLLIRYRGSNR